MKKSKGTGKRKLGRAPPCYICGNPESCFHHLVTCGAGGSDEPSNLLELCKTCHSEIHSHGVKSTTLKYNLPVDISGIYPRRSDL